MNNINTIILAICLAPILCAMIAPILKRLARTVGRRETTFREAYIALLWMTGANAVVKIGLHLAFSESLSEAWIKLIAAFASASVLTHVLAISLKMPWGRACITTAAMSLVGFVLGLFFVVIIGLVLLTTGEIGRASCRERV